MIKICYYKKSNPSVAETITVNQSIACKVKERMLNHADFTYLGFLPC